MTESTSSTERLSHRTDLIRVGPLGADANAFGWSQPGLSPEAPTASPAGQHRLLHALKRRGLVAFLVALPIAALAAAAVWRFKPEVYLSTAVLRFASGDKIMVFATADATDRRGTAFSDYKKTQRQLLRSRYVITRALSDENLAKLPVLKSAPDPVTWLEANLAVNFPDDAEVMTVSLSASRPDGLDRLVNAVIDSYFEEVVIEENKWKNERLNTLDVTHKQFEDKLRKRRSDLADLVKRVGDGAATKLSLEQQDAVDRYAALKQELHRVQVELMQVELELRDPFASSPKDNATQLEDELAMAAQVDPELQRWTSEKRQLQQYVKELRQRLTPEAAAVRVKEYDQKLKTIERNISVREAQLRKDLSEFKKRQLSAVREENDRRLRQLKAREERLNQLLAELQDEVRLPQSTTDVEMLKIDIAVLENVMRQIKEEIERTKVELQPGAKRASERVSKWSEAYPAQIADPYGKLKATAGTAAAGFLLPFLLLIWLESRNDRIYTREEIVGGLGLSVIGAVPLVPPRIMRRLGDPRIARGAYWRARLSESVDSIAAVLLRGVRSRSYRVVMVSSATAGEGKTTLAANLATSLAATGCRTALVDFDLRRPALHRVFDLPLQPGVCEVLHDPGQFDAAIQGTDIPNLSFVAAGRCGSRGLGRLSSERLKSLFLNLRSRFELVVVDASPILPVVDTRLIAQHVDTVVLSVLTDVSRVSLVRAATHQMEEFGISVIGAVMIGSKRDAYPHSYYDYADAI